jgi:hypothetical protein
MIIQHCHVALFVLVAFVTAPATVSTPYLLRYRTNNSYMVPITLPGENIGKNNIDLEKRYEWDY